MATPALNTAMQITPRVWKQLSDETRAAIESDLMRAIAEIEQKDFLQDADMLDHKVLVRAASAIAR